MLARHKLVLEFWDKKKELAVKNKEYSNFVRVFFSLLLKSDIKNEDLTTDYLIKKNKKVSAIVTAEESGILAGVEEFKFLNNDLKIKQFKKDGDKLKNDEMILEINGNAKTILERERTNLNLLQRMSGIATLTNSLNKKLKSIKIAATRKTLWGLLDKKAVSIGGGLTHRLNLSDGIIIKDNHLKLINYNINEAINLSKNKSKYIEIEVENKNQALTSAKIIKKISNKNNKSLFAIMLDKIPPKETKSIINKLQKQNLYDYVLLEASGNIKPENINGYVDCGVDVISMGFITNSAKVLNMSLEVK